MKQAKLNLLEHHGRIIGNTLLIFLLFTTLLTSLGAQNCMGNLEVSIGSDDTIRILPSSLYTRGTAMAHRVTIRRSNGLALVNNVNITNGQYIGDIPIAFEGCDLAGEVLTFTVTQGSVSCSNSFRVAPNGNLTLISNLDTAIWCVDSLLLLDPNDFANLNWYTDSEPYTLLPTANLGCDEEIRIGDPSSATFQDADINSDGTISRSEAAVWYSQRYNDRTYAFLAVDWTQTFGCGDSDTAQIVIRTWEAFNKDGLRSTVSDTIVVHRLPQLTAGIFDFAAMDTVSCVLDTSISFEAQNTTVCWSQMVGDHSNEQFVFYPLNDILVGADEARQSIAGVQLAQSLVIIDPATGDDIDLLDLDDLVRTRIVSFLNDATISPDPTPGGTTALNAFNAGSYDLALALIQTFDAIAMNYDLFEYDSKAAYGFTFNTGDQFLSDNGQYETATAQWLFANGGDSINICLPRITNETDTTIIDSWEGCPCEDGPQIILPNSPSTVANAGTITDCDALDSLTRRFCLNRDLLGTSNCGVNFVFPTITESLSTSCPRLDQRVFTIKQSCFSAAVNYGNIPYDDCGIDTSGVVSSTVTAAGEVMVSLEQWKMYLDTLPPTIDSVGNSLTISTDQHNCLASATVPNVRYIDRCSGVLLVKATLVGSGQWYEMEVDASGIWTLPSGRRFSVGAGTYDVAYEATDSCQNSTFDTAGTVTIIDEIDPTITAPSLTTTFNCGPPAWIMIPVDGYVTDNCGVCDVLLRRPDWSEACGVDLCQGPTSNLPDFTNEAEMDAYIANGGVDSVLFSNSDSVEGFYLEQYTWAVNDNNFCTDAQDVLLEGWRTEIKKYWADNCNTNNISITDNTIGGGWGDKLAICVEDACAGSIDYEILAFDGSGNYTITPATLTITRDPDTCSCIQTAVRNSQMTVTSGAYNLDGYRSALLSAAGGSSTALNSILTNGLPLRVDDVDAAIDAADNTRYPNRDVEDVDLGTGPNDVDFDWDLDTATTNPPLYEAPCDLEFTESVSTVFTLAQVTDSLCAQNMISVTRTFTNTATNSCAVPAGTVIITQSFNIILENVNAFLDKNDRETTCIRVDPSLFLAIATNSDDTLLRAGTEPNQLDDVTFPVTIDTVGGGSRNYGITFSDEYIGVLRDVVAPMDTIGAIYRRIFTVADQCRGSNRFDFSPDTTLLIIELDTLNSGGCQLFDGTPNNAAFPISGNIFSAFNAQLPIDEVTLVATDKDGVQTHSTNNQDGSFSLLSYTASDVLIEPFKDDDHRNGIDVLDILELQSIITSRSSSLGLAMNLATDVNNDGRINTKDLINLNQLSLSKIDRLPNNNSWRFFSDLTGEEEIRVSESASDVVFRGVKVGDLVEEGANFSRSNQAYELNIADINLEAGAEQAVSITSEAAIEATQFTLRYKDHVMEIKAITGSGITPDHWHHIAPGKIRVSYAGALDELELIVSAKKNVPLRHALTMSADRDFSSLAVVDGKAGPVELTFGANREIFELYTSAPNPTNDQAWIAFRLPTSQKATLSFFDVSGRLLHRIEGDYKRGLNRVQVSKDQLGTIGVVYYNLETTEHSDTKKMVIIE